MSDRPQFDYLDELAAQMKKAPSNPWDDKKTAEGNWWAGVYSMIRALPAAPVEPPVPDYKKLYEMCVADATRMSQQLDQLDSEPPVLNPVVTYINKWLEMPTWQGDSNVHVRRGLRTILRLLEEQSAPPVLSAVVDLVNEQAEDEGLWFEAQTMPEAYLQQELRRLHEVIENSAPPVLSRAALQKLADEVFLQPGDTTTRSWEAALKAVPRFIDAILEFLSQEASDD